MNLYQMGRLRKRKFLLIIGFLIGQLVKADFVPPKNQWTKEWVTENERKFLAKEVIGMFDHAWGGYMKYAFPEDELMPLTCKGRRRGREKSRGDIDDVLGNFSLTLIDTLDTMPLLNKIDDFNKACQHAAYNVDYNSPLVVSLFETNIRIIGGLLGAHTLLLQLKQKPEHTKKFSWYRNQLVLKAKSVADKMLPSFKTQTGIPRSHFSLKSQSHGEKNIRSDQRGHTCTACAGTLLLEFASLSHYTNNSYYEEVAEKALDAIWKKKNLGSNLVGEVINVDTGAWTRQTASIGAGIDSYYEYLLKAGFMLNSGTLKHRFQTHYYAIERYVFDKTPIPSQVYMNKPLVQARQFSDALWAFWPGLQTIHGDVFSAVQTHEYLYQVMLKNGFIPEAYNHNNFNPHWAQYLLRPEFAESTYFLYKATKDRYYLNVAKNIFYALEYYTRTECGYAAISNIGSMKKLDQMDSYFLSEMVKYLYLTFADEKDIPVDLSNLIFTTEAHFVPILKRTPEFTPHIYECQKLSLHEIVKAREGIREWLAAINYKNTFDHESSSSISDVLNEYNINKNSSANTVEISHPQCLQSSIPRDELLAQARASIPELNPATLNPMDKEQMETLTKIGIQMIHTADKQLQLIHNPASAESPIFATIGQEFMLKLINYNSKVATEGATDSFEPKVVQYFEKNSKVAKTVYGAPAQFGIELTPKIHFVGRMEVGVPYNGCTAQRNTYTAEEKVILLFVRGDCMFIDKAVQAEKAGAIATIIIDNDQNTTVSNNSFFQMSGDGQRDTKIPALFLYYKEAKPILESLSAGQTMYAHMGHAAWKLQDIKANLVDIVHKTDTVDKSRHFTAGIEDAKP